tara:strand:+ start:18 stop:602 length:585 start_codon:yes stop_codon:yes gene_type:complete
MIKSIGPKKLKTSVFISGNGSNLKSLIRFSKKRYSPIDIVFVVTNNKKARGLLFSKKNNIETKTYSFFKKKDAEIRILKDLHKRKVNLICLAGFMKILSQNFIKRFKGKIVNIHPSLLPKYKGLNTHKRVINNKEKYSGCTVHLVNSKLDSGKIIMQKKVKVRKNDNFTKLANRILKEEHILYPKAIKKLLSNL